MKNTIRKIRLPSGEVLKKGEDIKTEADRFFEDFLTNIPQDFKGMTVEELENTSEFRCSDLDSLILGKEVTEDEITKVLFGMPNNKSPGPDGFTCEFFKATWEITGKIFVDAIKSFFTKGFLPKGLNSTILSLIPEKEEAIEMKDFRPISCCNVIYKAISKVLANRFCQSSSPRTNQSLSKKVF